jgi:large subunit ribosomal protein L29
MKAQHYREMSQDEIESNLEELKRHLFDLRSQAVTEKIENSKAIINVRREIARIKTILRENSEKLIAENAEDAEKKL